MESTLKTFWGISSFQILAMFRRGLFYSYLSIYLRHYLGLSVTETTFFTTFPMILNIIFQTFVWGGISDKYQLRRTLIVWGELLAGIGTVIVWYAHTWTTNTTMAGYIIIAGLSVIEIFWSMSNIGWSALISDIYRLKQRTDVQGKLASLGGIGRYIGVWTGGLLYDGLGRQYDGWGFESGALFFVAAGVMFLSIIPMYFVPEGGAQKTRSPLQPTDNIINPTYSRLFIGFLVAMLLVNFGRNSVALILTQYLVLESGLAVSSLSLSYIVNTQSIAMVLSGLIAGRLAAKIGDATVLMTGTICAVVSLVIIGITFNMPMIYFSNFIRGVSEVVISASAYTFASRLIPPEKRGRLFGMFNATFFLSWGVGATLFTAPIIDIMILKGYTQVFSYQVAFLSAAVLTMAGLGVLAVVMVAAGKHRYRKDAGD
ncbi:MAG: MFS transporter [Desulfobacteraceae bacterium]|nr:MFS transporter [Desulfobacteraceae bacterium]